MKRMIACPACEWSKKLFTLERFENIDFFLDEREGVYQILGSTKIVHSYEYVSQLEKESIVIIITDTKKYTAIKSILEKYGLVENLHFFNGWKLSHKFYEINYAEKEWIEFEKSSKDALADMRSGWEKRSQKMKKLIPSDVKSILDVGCGEGLIRKYLSKDIKYYGLDYCKRENVDFVCDINREMLPDIKVDMILMAGVIEYFENVGRFLSQIKNVKYILVSKRRTEGFIRLDSFVTDGYMNYGKTEYYINNLINDMYQNGYVCVKMEWPWQERDEYYFLFAKLKDLV